MQPRTRPGAFIQIGDTGVEFQRFVGPRWNGMRQNRVALRDRGGFKVSR